MQLCTDRRRKGPALLLSPLHACMDAELNTHVHCIVRATHARGKLGGAANHSRCSSLFVCTAMCSSAPRTSKQRRRNLHIDIVLFPNGNRAVIQPSRASSRTWLVRCYFPLILSSPQVPSAALCRCDEALYDAFQGKRASRPQNSFYTQHSSECMCLSLAHGMKTITIGITSFVHNEGQPWMAHSRNTQAALHMSAK